MLIERVPWRVQPQTVQRLSPSVPRPALLLHGGAGFIDTIRQRTVTPNGVSIVAGQGGRGFKAASNASVGASFGTSQLSTSDGAGSGDFSLLLVASPVASTTREIMFCVRDGTRELYFTANCTVGLVASSGRIAVQTNVGGATGISVAGSVDGQLHTWLFTRQGTSQRLYRDGVLHASSTEAVRQVWTSSSTDVVGGYTAANWGVSSSVLLVGGWNSALSESDALSLSANPWQLFAPRSIWVPVSTAGGSVTGTSATTNANDTSTASGTTTVVGTSATTNAADTSAASGSVGGAVTGTSATTNANDASAASGTTTVTGTVAYSNANDTSTAAGWAGAISGTVAVTNADDASSAAGSAGSVQAFSGGWFPPIRRRTKKEIDDERRRLGILPPEVVEEVAAAPVARRRITLQDLIGKKAAAEITNVDLSAAIAASKKRKRQRDDELLMLM